jgi:protein-L-isoaspartate O-methyltransferase
MDELLEHYVARGTEPWNVSTEAAWLDFELRAWAEPILRATGPARVCNVGIGVGLWDDWLAHVIGARITSVDRDPDICRVFALRQARERHPHPAAVLCGDVLAGVLDGHVFELVTVIGSTLEENSGRAGELEDRLVDALAPGGVLLIGEALPVSTRPHRDAIVRRLGATQLALRTRGAPASR